MKKIIALKIIAFMLALCVSLVSLTSVFAQTQEQQSSGGYVIERQQYATVNFQDFYF